MSKNGKNNVKNCVFCVLLWSYQNSFENIGRKSGIFHEFLLEKFHDFFGIFGLLAEQLDGVDFACLELLHHHPKINGELDFGKAVAVKQAFFVIAE